MSSYTQRSRALTTRQDEAAPPVQPVGGNLYILSPFNHRVASQDDTGGALEEVPVSEVGQEALLTGLPPIVTVQQAAEVLQVSQNLIREFLRQGKLSGFLVGRLWRIPRTSLVDFARRGW